MPDFHDVASDQTFDLEVLLGDDFIRLTVNAAEADLIGAIARTGWNGWRAQPDELAIVRDLQQRGVPFNVSKPDSQGRIVAVLTAPIASAWQ